MLIEFKHLTETSREPTRASKGSAGFDLYADMAADGYQVINPGERSLVKTGIAMAFPDGYVGMICPRSGLALKNGVTVLNAPGIIDCDYRGDVGVILYNAGQSPFTIFPGDRIAQIVFAILPNAPVLAAVDDLDSTARGTGGFGSSGVSAS